MLGRFVVKKSHRPFSLVLALLCIPAVAAVACSVEVPELESGAGKAKGGGKKGSEASESGQKSGSKATEAKDSAESQGSEAEGLACDDSLDGVGWCEDDESILFCSDGEWWLLDCTAIEEEAFCGYDDEANLVDCYVLVDGEEECSDIDEECDADEDCCAGFCDVDGLCSDDEEECLDPEVECAADEDCCSGSCNDETALCD
jgi:hypothetical protein